MKQRELRPLPCTTPLPMLLLAMLLAYRLHLPSGHSVHAGDVVAVELDGKHVVGELWLLATLTDMHGEESDVACPSNWPQTGGTQYCRDFEINDESPTYAPLCAARSSLIYCKNSQKTLTSCIIPSPLRTCRFP